MDLIAIYNIEEREGKRGEDWFMRVIHVMEAEEAAPSDPPSAERRIGWNYDSNKTCLQLEFKKI